VWVLVYAEGLVSKLFGEAVSNWSFTQLEIANLLRVGIEVMAPLNPNPPR
jgi:hypothetical protein